MHEQLTLIGNLGRDPELRYTQSDTPVCNFSIATSRRWYDKNDELQEETKWWKITIWGKQAEHCNKYLSAGKKVFVMGEVTADWYENKDKDIVATLNVRAYKVQFLSSRDESDTDDDEEVDRKSRRQSRPDRSDRRQSRRKEPEEDEEEERVDRRKSRSSRREEPEEDTDRRSRSKQTRKESDDTDKEEPFNFSSSDFSSSDTEPEEDTSKAEPAKEVDYDDDDGEIPF